MPEKQPHTPPRQIRIPDEDWSDFDVAAKSMGTDRATVVRDFIRWYLRRPGAKALPRPPRDESPEHLSA
ncbi:hypothetical protein ABZ508_26640 [Streptomyces lavendulocolor]|uniref:Ribbon-helix-helix protein CopG domain-containing protein n=1 Tax=Streptomyces lavendulocolor TaxID=67316 RepID=A0ABV2WC94_9ACTN